MTRRPVLALALLALVVTACREPGPGPAAASPAREAAVLTGPWRFHASDDLTGAEDPAFDDAGWEAVSVPHTWGSERTWGSAWYRLRFALTPADLTRRVYLRFEGAATRAEVFVNGKRLGSHVGAYTAFVLDATPQARVGENVLAVRLDNRLEHTADSLPSGAGKQHYHVYGGLYRKAWLLRTPALHVDPADHASSGFYVTTRNVTARSADVETRTLLRNSGAERRHVEVRSTLLDRDGQERLTLHGEATLDPGAGGQVILTGRVASPRLWSPRDPHLYTARTELLAGGRVVDAVEERIGFRDFRMSEGRFLLNGEAVLLRGVGKHQETERSGAAVSDAELREDFAHLKELGVNMVRLAHYPHARLEYDLADELGLLVWAENGHSNVRKVAHPVGDVITTEMIRQNYNHPSIVIWSVGNETAFTRVRRYSDVARREDPGRIVAYASNTGHPPRAQYPNLDLVAQNVYRGWYQGEPWELEGKLLQWRYVAENGAGSVVSSHTDYADARHVVDAFEPEEYRQLMAEVQFQTVFRDHAEAIPMYSLWILRDFAVEKYKGRNTKGLLTYANFKKDAYYLYQAFLRPEAPVVHITSKTYFLRRGRADNGIKAYSNRERLALSVNGVPQGERVNGEFRHPNGRRVDNVFYWPARLRPGRNEVRVEDGAGHADSAVLYFHGAAEKARAGDGLVAELRSSNPAVPAFFVDKPVEDQWPFYCEFDGSADNTFDVLPEPLRGAGFVSTPRLSKPSRRTEITLRPARPADVFVMFTEGSPVAGALSAEGFADTRLRGEWRDNDLRLVPYRLYRRAAAAGQTVRVPPATADYVVLVKAAAGAGGS